MALVPRPQSRWNVIGGNCLAENGPRKLWSLNVGIGHSTLSVAGNLAYTMGDTDATDTVFAIDAATGKIVWKYSDPCNEKVGIKNYDGPFATPSVADGVVYTVSRKGDVFAFKARDGTILWTRDIIQEDEVKTNRFGGLAGSPSSTVWWLGSEPASWTLKPRPQRSYMPPHI